MEKVLFFVLGAVFFVHGFALGIDKVHIRPPFPDTPPAGTEYYTMTDDQGGSARVALWKGLSEGDELIFIYFEPITEDFAIGGARFTVLQGSEAYVAYPYDEVGLPFWETITEPKTLGFRVPIALGPAFNDDQPFDICNDSDYPFENCFTVNLSGITFARFSLDHYYTIAPGTEVILEVNSYDDRFYRFFLRAGYGTSDYEENAWETIQDWSSSSTCTHTFDTAGTYIIVCHIKESLDDTNYETIGFSIKVE